MESNYIVGVDIGSSKISGTIAEVDRYGNLKVIGSALSTCHGVRKGIIVNIDNTSEAIKDCILQMERMVNTTIDEIYLGISAGMCRILDNNSVIETYNDNDKVFHEEVQRVLEVESKVVEIKDSIANSMIECFERCNVKVVNLVLKSEGIFKIFMENQYKEDNVLFIDTGSDNSEVYYYRAGKIEDAFIVPLAGNIVTKDIATCTKISLEDAEVIKKKHGSLVKTSNYDINIKSRYSELDRIESDIIVDIISARIEEVLNIIMEKLKNKGYYEEISKVVLLGGGISLFEGAKGFTESIFSKGTYILKSQNILDNSLVISSLGIVKNVFNEVKLECDQEEDLIRLNKKSLENKRENKKNQRFTTKIKRFIDEFF